MKTRERALASRLLADVAGSVLLERLDELGFTHQQRGELGAYRSDSQGRLHGTGERSVWSRSIRRGPCPEAGSADPVPEVRLEDAVRAQRCACAHEEHDDGHEESWVILGTDLLARELLSEEVSEQNARTHAEWIRALQEQWSRHDSQSGIDARWDQVRAASGVRYRELRQWLRGEVCRELLTETAAEILQAHPHEEGGVSPGVSLVGITNYRPRQESVLGTLADTIVLAWWEEMPRLGCFPIEMSRACAHALAREWQAGWGELEVVDTSAEEPVRTTAVKLWQPGSTDAHARLAACLESAQACLRT